MNPEIHVSMDVHREGTSKRVSVVLTKDSLFYGVLRTALEEELLFNREDGDGTNQ